MFSECQDNPTYANDCPDWKDEFCISDDWTEWMKENCYKTCGYCDGITAPTTTATTTSTTTTTTTSTTTTTTSDAVG